MNKDKNNSAFTQNSAKFCSLKERFVEPINLWGSFKPLEFHNRANPETWTVTFCVLKEYQAHYTKYPMETFVTAKIGQSFEQFLMRPNQNPTALEYFRVMMCFSPEFSHIARFHLFWSVFKAGL